MTDEATDPAGQFLVGVLVWCLDTIEKPFLIELTELKKQTMFL